MQKRVHQLWIPGFLTLTLSAIFLITFQRLGFQPRIVGGCPSAILFYAPWLASLPFFGALGAHLSPRSGGLLGTVLLASVFPVLAVTAAFFLMFPIGFVIERIIGSPVDFSIVATAILQDGIGWILVPGAALLAGGFLVPLLFNRRSWSKETAIGSRYGECLIVLRIEIPKVAGLTPYPAHYPSRIDGEGQLAD